MPKKPAHQIRFGLIKACVWLNQSKGVHRYNVTVSRLYKNGDMWKESTHFGRDDLPLLAKVVDLAHSWIFQHDHGGERADSAAVSTNQRNS